MKTTISITLLLVCFLINGIAFAQNTLYFQGFENSVCPAADNWTYTGGKVNAETKRTGSNSARVGRAGESNTLIFDPANINGYTNVQLFIYHSVRATTGGNGESMDTREGAEILINVNGSGWILLGSVAGNTNTSWDWTAASGGATSASAPACNIYTMPNPFTYSVPAGATSIAVKVISIRENSTSGLAATKCNNFNNEMAASIVSNYDRSDEGFFIDDVKLITSDAVAALPGCALPVSLISFSGLEENVSAKLYWNTASEQNNTGYEIEKSTDGITFHKIGFVKGNDNSDKIIQYNFSDENFTADSYYRLKQIDIDGQFTYSSTIAVTAQQKEDWLKLYPVPASENLVLDLYSKAPAGASVEIMDILSKVQLRSDYTLAKGGNNIVMDVSFLESGMYFVTITSSLGKKETRLIQVVR